jgi:heavy metal sensor kinase
MNARAHLSLNSVRVRLTLWNVSVLALGLIGMGVIFSVSIRASVSAAVDRKLGQRAHHMQQRVSDRPQRMSHLVDDASAHGDSLRNGVGTSRQTPSAVPPFFAPAPPPGSSSDDPFGDLRPRVFDTQGKFLMPPGGSSSSPEKLWSMTAFRRSLQGEQSYVTVQDGADQVRVLSVPLYIDGKIAAVAQFGNSMTHIREDQLRVTRTLLTLIPGVLLIAGLGGAFLTNRALRPVRRITLAAGRIEAENLSRRLPVSGNDEFADLAETFNGMLSRLQTAFERQEEAFEQQRRFTADASHELRTPLTIIKANTSLALTGQRTVADYRQTLSAVDTAADRMNRIVQDLLLLARSDAGQLGYELAPTSLVPVLNQAAASLQNREHAAVSLAVSPESLMVRGNADALVRLFSNLLENAARYTPPEGRITISAEELGGAVVIKVKDTGEGIAPEHLPHVMERFYRAEAARSRVHGGTGLGLSICRSIVEAHGGEMSLDSVAGKGTTVRVTLSGVDTAPEIAQRELAVPAAV